MAGKPNQETTDGTRKSRRTYERLGAQKAVVETAREAERMSGSA